VETMHADDGKAFLGVFSPHRWDETFDGDQYAFTVTRTTDGVALCETGGFTELGTFLTVASALAHAVEIAEAAR
jgi:hypothetical protein